jgi:hypothetical protein
MKKVTGTVLVCLIFAAGCGQKVAETPAATAPTTSASASATTAPAASADSTGVPECDSYLKAAEKYLACNKVPQAARDAQAQATQAMKNGMSAWANMPPDQRKMAQDAAKTSCAQGLASLKQSATAIGCSVD